MKIVLASASPRRCQLLELVTEKFDVRPTDIDETIPENVAAVNAAEYLARKKAQVSKLSPGEIAIGCDTSVVIDNKVLGKPSDEDDCFEMLRMLSGRTHSVYTGCAVYNGEQTVSFTEKTDVTFYELSDEEILNYMKTGEPFDKAGGYGIQGKGSLLVKGINGDYFNVVGLPVARLSRELSEFIKKIEA